LDKAEQEHAKRAAAIQAEVEALEKRSQTKEARWDKEKERLEAALRRARVIGSTHEQPHQSALAFGGAAYALLPLSAA
jgi:hypothetical protein